ncbi:MAG: hypothetical protein ACLTSG_02380 [Lachnospiraceae bacterium]
MTSASAPPISAVSPCGQENMMPSAYLRLRYAREQLQHRRYAYPQERTLRRRRNYSGKGPAAKAPAPVQQSKEHHQHRVAAGDDRRHRRYRRAYAYERRQR